MAKASSNLLASLPAPATVLLLLGILVAQYAAAASGVFPNSNWGNTVGL